MKRINFACQRNRWFRVLVVTVLISLNLAPVQAQGFITTLRQDWRLGARWVSE
jgi:hypothetical protein